MKTSTSGRAGFTLVEVMIVVAIIGFLTTIAIPTVVKARETSQAKACIANLKQIEGAKTTWALEQQKNQNDTPTSGDLFGANMYIRETPTCPGGGTYTLAAVDTKPTCNISGHTL